MSNFKMQDLIIQQKIDAIRRATNLNENIAPIVSPITYNNIESYIEKIERYVENFEIDGKLTSNELAFLQSQFTTLYNMMTVFWKTLNQDGITLYTTKIQNKLDPISEKLRRNRPEALDDIYFTYFYQDDSVDQNDPLYQQIEDSGKINPHLQVAFDEMYETYAKLNKPLYKDFLETYHPFRGSVNALEFATSKIRTAINHPDSDLITDTTRELRKILNYVENKERELKDKKNIKDLNSDSDDDFSEQREINKLIRDLTNKPDKRKKSNKTEKDVAKEMIQSIFKKLLSKDKKVKKVVKRDLEDDYTESGDDTESQDSDNVQTSYPPLPDDLFEGEEDSEDEEFDSTQSSRPSSRPSLRPSPQARRPVANVEHRDSQRFQNMTEEGDRREHFPPIPSDYTAEQRRYVQAQTTPEGQRAAIRFLNTQWDNLLIDYTGDGIKKRKKVKKVKKAGLWDTQMKVNMEDARKSYAVKSNKKSFMLQNGRIGRNGTYRQLGYGLEQDNYKNEVYKFDMEQKTQIEKDRIKSDAKFRNVKNELKDIEEKVEMKRIKALAPEQSKRTAKDNVKQNILDTTPYYDPYGELTNGNNFTAKLLNVGLPLHGRTGGKINKKVGYV